MSGKQPTDIELALLTAASNAIEMTTDEPIVTIATRGPGETTTLLVLAVLIPDYHEQAAFSVLNDTLEVMGPMFKGMKRRDGSELDS